MSRERERDIRGPGGTGIAWMLRWTVCAFSRTQPIGAIHRTLAPQRHTCRYKYANKHVIRSDVSIIVESKGKGKGKGKGGWWGESTTFFLFLVNHLLSYGITHLFPFSKGVRNDALSSRLSLLAFIMFNLNSFTVFPFHHDGTNPQWNSASSRVLPPSSPVASVRTSSKSKRTVSAGLET